MAQRLELPTRSLDYAVNFFEKKPEDTIYNTYLGHFRAAIGVQLLSPDFDPHNIRPTLLQIVTSTTPRIIEESVAKERVYSKHSRPLHERLGELAIDPTALEDVELDEFFALDLRTQLEGMTFNFGSLGEMHKVFKQTRFLELAANIESLANVPEESDWFDKAYELVKQATARPAEYTVPVDDSESIYLYCFLPNQGRRLTRELAVGNLMMAKIEEKVGTSPSDDSRTMLDAIRELYRLEVLAGDEWKSFQRDRIYLNEEHSKEFAILSARRLDILGQIQSLVYEGKGKDVVEAYRAAQKELAELIEQVHQEYGLGLWEIVDIGHGFSAFRNRDLEAVIDRGPNDPRHNEYYQPTKNGLRAAILEDDDEQLDVWRGTVDRHTEFVAGDEYCTNSPDKALAWADNLGIGLFILDTQIGDDDFAGARVAEEIYKTRLAQLREAEASGSGDSFPRTKIILWSNSVEHVRQAGIYFDSIFKQTIRPGDRVSHSTALRGGNYAGRSLVIDIRGKEWSAITHVPSGGSSI